MKEKHKCLQCASAFGRAGNLSRHVRTVHEKPPPMPPPVSLPRSRKRKATVPPPMPPPMPPPVPPPMPPPRSDELLSDHSSSEMEQDYADYEEEDEEVQSRYELTRSANIARNARMMVELGLGPGGAAAAPVPNTQHKRKRAAAAPAPKRRNPMRGSRTTKPIRDDWNEDLSDSMDSQEEHEQHDEHGEHDEQQQQQEEHEQHDEHGEHDEQQQQEEVEGGGPESAAPNPKRRKQAHPRRIGGGRAHAFEALEGAGDTYTIFSKQELYQVGAGILGA